MKKNKSKKWNFIPTFLPLSQNSRISKLEFLGILEFPKNKVR